MFFLELFPFDTFACPELNFLTLSSNDTKLGVHVSCNELVQSSRTITLPYVFLELFSFDTFACQKHNFLTLCSNDTKLGVHVSCNALKCKVQEP